MVVCVEISQASLCKPHSHHVPEIKIINIYIYLRVIFHNKIKIKKTQGKQSVNIVLVQISKRFFSG